MGKREQHGGGGRGPGPGGRPAGRSGRGPRPASRGPASATTRTIPAVNAGRDAACRRLTRLARKFPELPYAEIDERGLSEREAALAHAIVENAAQRWLTLTFLLNLGLKTPFEELEAPVQGALLAGAAQLVLMDGAPARAVVHEAVEWAKTGKKPRSGGLVNAGLRRLSELLEDPASGRPLPTRDIWSDGLDEIPLGDGRARVLRDPALPDDRLRRLSIATSHPLELLRHWSKSMSAMEVRNTALHGLLTPPIILNTAHATTPLPEEWLSAHRTPGRHVFVGPFEALDRMLRERTDIWAQDPASALAVESVSDLSPKVIVDVCAGRGTKTRQIAAQFPDARIVASDTDKERLEALGRVFRSDDRVSAVAPDDLLALAGQADLVLLDVPCSNTGVLARRIEARYRATDASVESLIGVQRQIIADSVRLLHSGGAILYSTCSLDPRENEDQLQWAAKWHGFSPERVRRTLPEGVPGDPAEQYSDGSFSGLLV